MPKARYFDGTSLKPISVDVFFDTQGQVCIAEEGSSNILIKAWPADISFGGDGVSRKGFSFNNRKGQVEFLDDRSMRRFFDAAPQRSIRLGRTRLSPIILILGAVLAVGLGYFFLVPVIVDTSVKIVSREQERELFKAPAASLKDAWKVDSQKSKSAKQFFNAMKLPDIGPVDVYVIQDPGLVNAFAMPGGTMFITTAMLDRIKTPEQLAALIGHEYGHIYHRHGMKMIARSLGLGLAFGLVFGDASGLVALFGSAAEDLASKTYSRDFEREADDFAIQSLADNKLSITGMPELFAILKKESGSDHNDMKMASYFSTHPMIDERIEAGKEAAKAQAIVTKPDQVMLKAFEELKR